VAVEAADDEPLRRRDRGGRADPLDDEADEGLQEYDCAGHEQERAERLQRRPGHSGLPAGEPPWDESGDDAGSDGEEQSAP
jgi:hypothetical protein